MRKLNLTLVSLLTVAGCSQVLGLGDYDIDPALDGKGGSSIGAGGDGQGEAGGDSRPTGGAPPAPVGGEPNLPIAGQAGQGGEPQGQAGEGGAPPREVIPCDSADCCADKGGTPLGVELLSDGGFELGPVSGGESPWLEESTLGYDVVVPSADPVLAFLSKAGDYYAYLSGVQGERSTIYSENVTIPADAGWLTLTGYRLFQIDVQDEVNEDFCLIAFYEPEVENPLEIPFWWGKPSENADGWGDTPTWKKFEASWDAAPHQSLERYIGLRGESDAYPVQPEPSDPEETYASSFLFDQVSLQAFTCVK